MNGSKSLRNPNWTRDELIVALNFYFECGGCPPSKSSEGIKNLSNTISSLVKNQNQHSATYRNVNGVYMKLMNFRRFDPAFSSNGGVGLRRGGALEEKVWSEFFGERSLCEREAARIVAEA